ncbi:bifunctional phosphopantothenoylcysteine decarboxylase/phosphopantothenate--cysteine ligase CoaBC [Maribacter sp. MMG018]|uniref:bifunctional phosphopantothenoylcysteine decarboxylase/phosphopantothenate--cysteine ligase CoaBC n=1 Tax=Maribacter sp. MMG018 TaxID=2822688 RepID=UPI001B3760B2|nr:bifunctional phosphopantothenoylcysteine decarboxylase/phosphopantothenate--cysteine ligase CoaBC [Maribacter sp. MMG018]MBQ4914911.1 bifunctional phosphopantothenoylcysteine decarboxylase/phosphopantothenate--cysteine ligase CoaBC [Maribacter sp. MMG018]
MLSGKNILLGITGGIAAYKTTFLVRLLIKAGATVKIVLTDSASSFVSPLTLATLSKNPVVSDFVKNENHITDWNNHVKLGLWADLMIIAPATANTLSKMASGNCDNLLMACYLSAKCPVFFAPAMDLDMYRHPTTKTSFERLESFGNIMIPATSGELASGLHGEGRMAEPETILSFIKEYLLQSLPLRNKKVLITAGPTYEAIDPVRFIGNHSSGLMGFELANAAAKLGAQVTLVSGPTHCTINNDLVTLVRVVSADEMYDCAHQYYSDADIVICAAAVADYKPKEQAEQKIKKSDTELNIALVKNKDILFSLGQIKKKQYLVGFALETENELENAKGKLERKNLDAIVLNSLNDKGAGFGGNTNKISFIDTNLTIQTFDLKTKADVAKDILNEIIKRRYA